MSMLEGIGGGLEKYMTLVSERQKVVVSNIANADTPGYRTQDIDFEHELANAMAGISPTATTVDGLRAKNDGNNVSLDRESRLLAENAMRFNIASNLLRTQIKSLRSAIDGGSSAS